MGSETEKEERFIGTFVKKCPYCNSRIEMTVNAPRGRYHPEYAYCSDCGNFYIVQTTVYSSTKASIDVYK